MENGRLEPRIINSSVLTKSMSQSRVPRAALGWSYLTSLPPRDASKPVWYKKLFCQGAAIIGSLRKEKKERQKIARKQDRMEDHLERLSRR
ncbi:hypothetical protein RHSIM_RhsimUnG0040400 [Rhododendron simsii]|uniref:Uncharacterized protein n=1 Tax=Rhododendron simsii TaxID=118357 RepID=A0A834FWJ5_RHOSS|nr:hypothetical protein RHSIM_RhsimUnG0040400 [Rhododendron simsii]